jgi:methylthioxylose transferase
MSTSTRTGPVRADLVAGAAALALFATAAGAGALLFALGHPVRASSAPLHAHWLPHVGPGTPVVVAIAVLAVWHGPAVAARLPWRSTLVLAYGTALLWTLSLALIDGWERGVAGRLNTRHEYLHEVPGVTAVPDMLRDFTSRILDFQPDSWTTHVAGHPPGALLLFVWLDRLGAGGGAWAGLVCIVAGAGIAVAVPHTVRTLGSEEAARAIVPFLALFPGAVWIGVSADGLFAGVTATGIALLAVGVRRGAPIAAAAGGLLLGFACYLSYGLVLSAPLATVVIWLGTPGRRRTAWWAAAGAAAVAAAFTAAGFGWLTGYHLVTDRYYQGIAAERPYAYWVWADIAILTVSAGPVAAVVLRRATLRAVPAALAVRSAWRRGWRSVPHPGPETSHWLLVLAAAAAILAADLSGLSKAEVERIWLPFAVWLLAGAALVPARDRRRWLAVQAAVALTVNHLLLTTW